jgi:hypothetical protein
MIIMPSLLDALAFLYEDDLVSGSFALFMMPALRQRLGNLQIKPSSDGDDQLRKLGSVFLAPPNFPKEICSSFALFSIKDLVQ